MKKILFCCLILLAGFGCRKNAAEKSANFEAVEASPVKDENVSLPANPKDNEIAIIPEQRIIREANLRFPTANLEETHDRISTAVKKYNGLIQNDIQGTENAATYRSLIVRVPSQDFDAFLKEISRGVGYFESKEISSEDVSEEYVDVDSRIKTKKALEDRYLELLKKANSVTQMLEVEKQLSEIREEIESRQARLQYLKLHVAMSTFTVYFYKTTANGQGATVSYGAKIGNALKSGINALSNFFIWLLEVWPFILILVALIFLFRKKFRKRKKL